MSTNTIPIQTTPSATGGFPRNATRQNRILAYPNGTWNIGGDQNRIEKIYYLITYNTQGNSTGIYCYFSDDSSFILEPTNGSYKSAEIVIPDNVLQNVQVGEQGNESNIKLLMYPVDRDKTTVAPYAKYISSFELKVDYGPKASPSTATVDSVNMSSQQNVTQTITINQTVSGLYHDVSLTYNKQGGIVTKTAQKIEEYSTAFSFTPEEMMSICRLDNSKTQYSGTVVITTFTKKNDGSYEQIGNATSASCYMNIPTAEAMPSITIVLANNSKQDAPNNIKALISGGNYVQNFSIVSVTPTVQTNFEASSTVNVVTSDGPAVLSGSVWRANVLSSGQFTVTATVTDSRGLSSSVSQTVQVLACESPSFLEVDIHRCIDTQQSEEDDEGTVAYIYIRCQKNGISGNDKLSVDIQVGNTHAGTPITQFVDGIGEGEYYVTQSGGFDKEQDYFVSIAITDDLGITTQYEGTLRQASYTIYRLAGGKGVAFGKICEMEGVEVSSTWPFYVHGEEIKKLIVDISHPVGSTVEMLESYQPNDIFPGTLWSRIGSDSGSIARYIWVRAR